tara:strand:- start:198 stop:455 length:258 start_codon:yes stop_codon:yes gene_type:complete
MKNYLDEIRNKIKEKVEIENLEIVNNSEKHRGHKFFSEDKLHLHIKIKSSYLKSLSRINAQKTIMKILKEDLKKKIHALQISIEP